MGQCDDNKRYYTFKSILKLSFRMENDIARIELATAHRALASYNLNEGVNNHMTSKAISRFDETKEIILMLPFGKQWSDARPDDFLEIDSGAVSDLQKASLS